MRTNLMRCSLFCLLLLGACAGGRGYLRASPGLTGPVSLTDAVFDSDGRVLDRDDLEVVGRFEETGAFWATLASFLSLSGTWDLTPFLNEQMARYGGEAIIDFSAETTAGSGWLHYFAALTIVVPSYTQVTVRGDVVRRRQQPAPSGQALGAAPPLEAARAASP